MRDDFLNDIPTAKRSRPRSARPMTLRIGREFRGASASAQIYQILRGEIISLNRKPGDPIFEKEIGSTLGVSRTPIREAILRLAAENLIEIVPQSGTFVAQIPLDKLPEAIVVRRTLEELTVRTAARRASNSQIVGLRAILELQQECAAANNPDGFHQADDDFHAAVAEAAGYPGVWPLIQQVKIQVDRFCHLSLPEPGRMDRLIREHTAIVDGIAGRDGDQAIAALERHIGGLAADLGVEPDLNPNYFSGNLPKNAGLDGSPTDLFATD
jgi:DNA-binding GntR family transcriptional regulator